MENLSEIGKYPFLLFTNKEVTKNSYTFFDTYKDTATDDSDYNKVINNVFFSQENINIIHADIRRVVYERSNYNIPKQNNDHLVNIMMDIYKTFCQNLPNNIKQQIVDLNKRVVDHVYPYIVSQIDAIQKYREEIEGPIRVNPLPQSTTIQGQKTLPAFR